uniref:MICOS complex subunit MIC26-like isoform X4 n=1 Tax=Pristiophorus japonicus TaxID=55135 RepID=UPI00398E95A6
MRCNAGHSVRRTPTENSMVVGLTTLGTSLSPVSVFAQSEKQQKGLLKVEQLSLYTTPAKIYRFEEVPPSQLEQRISELRKLAEPYSTGYQGVYTTVKPRIEKAVQLGKGSRVRKVVYSCGFVAACGSLYYPQETIEAAKVTSATLYETSVKTYLTIESLWKKYTDKEQQPAPTVGVNQTEDIQSSGPNTTS